MTKPCKEHDYPEGARYCVMCGTPDAATGRTARLDKRFEVPVLGFLNGSPVFEYSAAIWCNPGFVPAYPFAQG